MLAHRIANKFARLRPSLRDDFVGECLLTAVRLAGRPEAYIVAAMCNSCRDLLRKEIRAGRPPARPRATHDGEVEIRELLDLCGCDREIIRLRLEGYSDEEIGEQLGISAGSVYRRRLSCGKRLGFFDPK